MFYCLSCYIVWLFLCDCQLFLEITFKFFSHALAVDFAPTTSFDLRVQLALRVVTHLSEVVNDVVDFFIAYHVLQYG